LAITVTVKGQAALPEAVREAEIVEADAGVKTAEAYISRLQDMSHRRPIRGTSTEEIMRMTRGED
jgi:hypothetical protein